MVVVSVVSSAVKDLPQIRPEALQCLHPCLHYNFCWFLSLYAVPYIAVYRDPIEISMASTADDEVSSLHWHNHAFC